MNSERESLTIKDSSVHLEQKVQQSHAAQGPEGQEVHVRAVCSWTALIFGGKYFLFFFNGLHCQNWTPLSECLLTSEFSP
jgi:hypothetical protein